MSPETDAAAGMPKARSTLPILALLYATQGIPFGIAAEYLPIELTDAGYTQTQIAALSWLQLPWQAKLLWSSVADGPLAKRRGSALLFGMQVVLALCVAGFAAFPFASHRSYWFGLTLVTAFIAATQDIFVDAFAVRRLHASERGLGNVAQVAGYRCGMLAGGAGLLLCSAKLGVRESLLALAATIFACAFAARLFRESEYLVQSTPEVAAVSLRAKSLASLRRVLAHAFRRDTVVVLVVAATFKLGLHMASAVLKPMVRQAGWSKAEIGFAVVTVGTVGGLLGASAGGGLHRLVRERSALVIAGVLQALVCVPLFFVERLAAPKLLTTVAFFAEHFASGLGTTCLFAALMTATRKDVAGAHYTLLTSANALAIGLGGLVGAGLADLTSRSVMFVVAALVSALSLAWLRDWEQVAQRSALAPD